MYKKNYLNLAKFRISRQLFLVLLAAFIIPLLLLGSFLVFSRSGDAAEQPKLRTRDLSIYNAMDMIPAGRLGAGRIIDLAWFYKPPDDGNPDLVARHFQTYILTKKDEGFRDSLEARGASGPFLQYLRIDAIMDPGDCDSEPWQNQVAFKPGDFCDISDNHKDWFLRAKNGDRIDAGEDFWMMDPSNEEWRAFWLERAIESQEKFGWDGVFIDNLEASIDRFERKGIDLKWYPDDASYQAEMEEFLQYITESYFKPEDRPLSANIINVRDSEIWFRYLNYLDSAMDESFAVDWLDGYLEPDSWEEHLSRAEETQKLGKFVILVAQGEEDDLTRQEFAFASYLLITSGQASFRYAHNENYSDLWLYPNYDVNLGFPRGERFWDGEMWRRDFARGYVRVDPEEQTASIVVYPCPLCPNPSEQK
ncbi:MAG: hypothetical protein EHM70_06545 [Chloroflexota bacterium]|nr:MAG: hypothetical protein EHM70_06545 [Chloroflexota bacterium]